MDVIQHPHELRTRETNGTSELTSSATFDRKSQREAPEELQVDLEDDLSRSSRPPSMTDGSSRAPSIYSTSEHGSVALTRHYSEKSRTCRSISDTDSVSWPQEDENNSPRLRSESPLLLWQPNVSRIPRYSSPLSLSPIIRQHVEDCCQPTPAAKKGFPLRPKEDIPQPSRGLGLQNTLTGNLDTATRIADTTISPGTPAFASESTDSNDDSEEDSDDELEGDDNDWSGENGYFENAILQAAFPDLELAAHLITHLFSMLYPGSSKRISRKVSFWRQRITACTTDSGTVSTEKAPSSNATTGTARRDYRKRDRLSGPTDGNIGEEEDEEEDDSDERRRKRLKENHGNSALAMPTPRLACPFFKMNPSKYCVQHNQEGQVDEKQYRICAAGPGFRTIQLLKEHLKRKHYPVQCDRCYLIFKVKGNDRSSAVAELEKHRQLDERCPRNQPSMKEGISDAQWASLDEKKQNKKGKSSSMEKPKSDLEKWLDIWSVLFPDLDPPPTPWYHNIQMDIPASFPSQGLHYFLEVYERTLEFRLPGIKKALSDAELKALLLDLAQKAFQVWSATFTWNEASTSSLSNAGGSNPLSSTSWEHITGHTSTGRQPSPPTSSASVFPNLERGNQHRLSGTTNNIAAGHQCTNTNQQLPHYPTRNIPTGPQDPIATPGDFIVTEAFGAGVHPFSQNGYSTNTSGVENSSLLSQVEFSNTANFDEASMMGGIQADFDMPGVIPPDMLVMNSHWGDQHAQPHFSRYGGAP